MTFNVPDILSEIGSVMNLSGASSLEIEFGNQSSDTEALRSDWYAIGNDMKKAFSQLIEENTLEKNAKK